MSKPIIRVTVRSIEGESSILRAVIDSGSHFSIIREAKLPPHTHVLQYPKVEMLKTATRGGRLQVTGATLLYVQIGKKRIRHEVLVSPDLGPEMLIGAGAMQEWDISIRNGGGRTRVTVGRDIRDPEITTVA